VRINKLFIFLRKIVFSFLRIITKIDIFAFWNFQVSDMAKQFHTTVTTAPAPNVQFATIGGVARKTLCAEQHHLALVQAFAMPPPAASCYLVVRKLYVKFFH